MPLNEKFLNNKEDIIYYTAKESGISVAQMEVIEKAFWKGVRDYIINPHTVKDMIVLDKFLLIRKKVPATVYGAAIKRFYNSIKLNRKDMCERYLNMLLTLEKANPELKTIDYKEEFKKAFENEKL